MIKIVISKIDGSHKLLQGIDAVYPYVVLEVRFPRILTSAIVGAGLSIAGVVFQGILLDPLADPYTLGISAETEFGAPIALLLDVTLPGDYSVPLFGFIVAVAALFAGIFLYRKRDSNYGQTSIYA